MNCMNVQIGKNDQLFLNLTISFKLIETKHIHAYIKLILYLHVDLLKNSFILEPLL